MTGLWKTWIAAWCWGVILFGAVLAAAGLPATDGVARALYNVLGNLPAGTDVFEPVGMRFSVALMGALSIGWGFTVLFLLPAVHSAGAPAWRGLTAAILIWFVIDSAFSVMTGFALNAVSNIGLVAFYLVPVLASGVLKSAR
jgi:pheromone shutdown protein TraB